MNLFDWFVLSLVKQLAKTSKQIEQSKQISLSVKDREAVPESVSMKSAVPKPYTRCH